MIFNAKSNSDFLKFIGGSNLTTFSPALIVRKLFSCNFWINFFWSLNNCKPSNNPTPRTSLINFGDHKRLKKLITKKTAAIMVETIMGEGGIKVIPDWCIKGLRKLCNNKNILLILDEVQCGIGRTGDFFAFEKSKVKPDIVPIAKGIGGGFPLGAVLMTKKVAKSMSPGSHGSTFGGNPLAMSVGNAVLDQIFKKGFLNNLKKVSKYFFK